MSDPAQVFRPPNTLRTKVGGGFGINGTAQIKAAVPDTVAVGVVRFDGHPGLDNQSGDSLFG